MRLEANSRSRGGDETSVTPERGAMMAIGELATLTGVPATTIRYYDRIGLLAPSARVGDKRRFDGSAVRRLTAVALCTAAGFSLDEVRELLLDETPGRVRSHALATAKLAQLDEQMAQLTAAKGLIERGLRCTCVSLDECTCGA